MLCLSSTNRRLRITFSRNYLVGTTARPHPHSLPRGEGTNESRAEESHRSVNVLTCARISPYPPGERAGFDLIAWFQFKTRSPNWIVPHAPPLKPSRQTVTGFFTLVCRN